ncbi:MAG: cytochrome c biogenesis protein CcsA [Deltaproteobacteria bacterium]|nr:cytochrome c biogenesis protein CcsA [Deltaproteobacteria bacterium]
MTSAYAIVYWLVAVVYALAVGAEIAGQVFRRERLSRSSNALVLVGVGVHATLIAWRWIQAGHAPVIGAFENCLLGAWFIVVMVVWTNRRRAFPLLAAGALPLALLLLGFGGMAESAPSPFVASLRSFWLYIHIFFAWLAYGAYSVACGAAVVYLVKSRAAAAAPPETLARLDELMFRATVFGFVTDAVLIAAGAIWAKNLWGSYWSWDPVETWSLLSWLIYGLALHLRTTLGWRRRRLAWVLVFAIVGVLISFWGVKYLMPGTAHVFTVD